MSTRLSTAERWAHNLNALVLRIADAMSARTLCCYSSCGLSWSSESVKGLNGLVESAVSRVETTFACGAGIDPATVRTPGGEFKLNPDRRGHVRVPSGLRARLFL